MRTPLLALSVLLAALALAPTPRAGAEAAAPEVRASRSGTPPDGVPLHFEANRGQFTEGVRFQARTTAYTAAILDDGAILVSGGAAIRMRFAGARQESAARGARPQPGRSHYLRGEDPEAWVRDVPHFGEIVVEDLYPGVALHWLAGEGRRLRYDLVLEPGADAGRIALSFDDGHGAEVRQDGTLRVTTDAGVLTQTRPRAHQSVGGERRDVAARFVPRDDGRIGFALDGHDPARPVVIDPTLTWSTYVGGTGGDNGQDVAIDALGAVYVTGTVDSPDYPLAGTPFRNFLSPSSDVVVTKIAPDGQSLVYSTYLGGATGGGGVEFGNGIAVDGTGHAYVTGVTQSTDFPTTVGAFQTSTGGGSQDAFVAKLSPGGNALVYATYLGGSMNDSGHAIAVDVLGQAFVTGSTFSPNFPLLGAIQNTLSGNADAFVTVLSPSGAGPVYSTYLGGGAVDYGRGIALAGSPAEACVVGFTLSANFPTTPGAAQAATGGGQDAFVARVNSTGSALVYATYLGGTATETGGGDNGGGIATDPAGNVYVTGSTASADFPTTQGAFQTKFGAGLTDAFAAKLNPAGSAFVYATFLGGTGDEQGEDIAVRASDGTAYVTGRTSSMDFPVANPLQGSFAGGASDAFVTRLGSGGSALLYSTYLGGSGPVEGNAGTDVGHGIAVNGAGYAYATGDTNATDFPTQAPFQASNAGTQDAWLAKIDDVTLGPLAIGTSAVPIGEEGVVYGASLDISGGTPPYTVEVIRGKLPDGLMLDDDGIFSGVPTKARKWPFTVRVTDSLNSTDEARYKLRVVKAIAFTTRKLRPGQAGKPYRARLKARRGAKPHAWSVPTMNLPLGLELDAESGRLTGTPTVSADVDVNFRVADAAGGTAERVLPLVIDPPDLRGRHDGTGSWTLTGCDSALHDGAWDLDGTFRLTRQKGAEFRAWLKFDSSVGGFTRKTKLTIRDGMIANDKDLSGTFEYRTMIGRKTIARGSGTFSGVLSAGIVDLAFQGQASSGDACSFDGTFRGE